MTKTKEDIVHNRMTSLSLDRSTARKYIETLLKLIKDTLSSGSGVMISGFGEFRIKRKSARTGRNPKTKIEYEISERSSDFSCIESF
jgi:nucleoid DNA-binding protein